MTLINFTDGEVLNADDLNSLQASSLERSGLNIVRELQDRSVDFTAIGGEWAEAYSDSNGRLNSVDADNTNAVFETDKYKQGLPVGSEPFVIVEADSLSASWSDNDCLTKEIGSGKWIVFCTTGTDEERRAQIHKSLWYGTDGSDSLILDFTSVTAVKTNVTRDIGKQAHYAQHTESYYSTPFKYGYYTGTFSNTTTNTDVSSWSYLNSQGQYTRWEIASGSIKHTQTTSGTSDEMGTDTTADEIDNPADCQLEAVGGQNTVQTGRVVVLCVGDITWVNTATSGSVHSYSNIDFLSDHSIPVITDGSSETFDSIITHDLPFEAISSETASYTDVTEYSGSSTNYVSTTINTISSIDRRINSVTISFKRAGSTNGRGYVVFNYSDSTSSSTYANITSTSYVESTLSNSNPEKTVSSIEIKVAAWSSATDTYYCDELSLFDVSELLSQFGPTISSSFGTALVADWEEGADIQYKLTNATEDSGWLTYNEVGTFTAFTSEPTKCIVKLIPKTTSPTTGYPSIKGFCVYG